MNLQASIFISIIMAAPMALAQTPGTGSPSNLDYCEHNARAVDSHRPTNIVNAEEALESAEEALRRAEDKFDEADSCQLECKETVYEVIRLAVGERNLQDYLDYLGGSFECYGVANSAVRKYNMYAQLNGWDVMQEYDPSKRMVAGVDPSEGTTTEEVSTSTPETTTTTVVPTTPAPQHQTCIYMGPNNTLDLSICEAAQRNGLSGQAASRCRTCLGPRNKYGTCLRDRARFEQDLYEAQNLVEKREAELSAAMANPSSDTTCTECIEDTRSWWQKVLPTVAAGALVAVPGYFAYKAAKESYDYAINVTHENNSRLGYASQPEQDLSGYQLAAHLLNGAPLVLNTALGTGLLGCSGSTFYGAGQVLSGALTGAQIGGSTGYSADILGNITGILGGDTSASVTGGFDANGNPIGTGTPSAASIEASILASQQNIEQQYADLQALQNAQAYYNSRNAILETANQNIINLGQAPTINGTASTNGQITASAGTSGYTNGTYNPLDAILGSGGQISGGIVASGQIQTYGNAGLQTYSNTSYQVPTTGTPFVSGNQTQVPYTHQTTNSNVRSLNF